MLMVDILALPSQLFKQPVQLFVTPDHEYLVRLGLNQLDILFPHDLITYVKVLKRDITELALIILS